MAVDTVPGSESSTVVVTVGTPLNGEIDSAYEQDWYRVALTANTTYTIRMVGLGTSTYSLGDPLIEGIYNSAGTWQGGFNNDGLIAGPNGRDAMITFRPATSTNYWIATAGDLGSMGTFQISVTNSNGGTDNVLATTATTGTVAVGGSVTGTIDATGDADWYRVALTAGTTYTFSLRGLVSGLGTLADPVIAGLYDSAGNYIPNTYVDDLGAREPSLTLAAPATANYYLAAAGWTTYTGTFNLSVAATTADVAGNSSSTTTLAIGASEAVTIGQPYDHDWYKVTLTAGTTYQFSLSGTGSNNTPGIHGVFDATGKYLGSYAAAILGPSSAAATTIFTPSVSGAYFIDTYSIYQGSYTLTTAQVAADVPGNLSTTATVAVNGSVNGDIGGATDIDWYGVSLAAGTTYVIKMQGAQSSNGTLEDPMIASIYNAAGTIVANTFSDDSDGNEPSLVFRPSSNGTYYIAADGYAGYTGSYQLSVNSIPGDVGQTTATATNVALNTPTLVTIDDASDTDWYAVALTGGSTYGIRLQGAATQRGTIYDPVLVGVYDSTGTLVSNTWVDDARGLLNAMLSFTPATSGTYYVAADGYDRFTGTMKLAVTIDDIGNTNGTAGSFVAGTPTEGTIDTIGDIDRYAVTLEASTVYYFRMQGFHSRNGDLTDPNISAILNGAGAAQTLTVINEATTVGLDSWVKMTTAATPATYYIVAEGTGTDGAFLLTSTKDIAGGTTTTASVTVGGSVTGFIDEGTDADWYSVVLSTNTSYVIKMLGLDSGNGTLADPLINGVRLSTTPTTIINGTSGAAVDNAVARDSVARLIPAANGTYYIAAENGGTTAVGTYVLSVAIEPGNTVASAFASALVVGGSVNGTIDDTTDADWYKVSLLANTGYMFKLQGTDSGGGTLDDPLFAATGAIRNSTGTAVTPYVIGAVGMDSYVHYAPTVGGDYYIEAQGGGTDTGTFTLTAETEVGHTAASSTALALGGSLTGKIDDSADADWYKVALTNGQSYVFKMLGLDTGNGTLINPNIPDIRTAAGATLTGEIFGTGVGNDAVVRFVATSTADFIIDAQGTGGAGTYTVSAALEAGGANTNALAITVGGSLVGAIDDAADIDRYFVTLTAGTRYRVRLEGADSANGTLIDPYINGIRNAAGTVQTATTQDGGGTGSDAYVIYTPGTTATYYIDADNGVANATAIGTYKLSVELWP